MEFLGSEDLGLLGMDAGVERGDNKVGCMCDAAGPHKKKELVFGKSCSQVRCGKVRRGSHGVDRAGRIWCGCREERVVSQKVETADSVERRTTAERSAESVGEAAHGCEASALPVPFQNRQTTSPS